MSAALRASTIALIVSLVGIGYLAVRRVRLPLGQRLIVLFAEFGLGIAVVLLELLAHGTIRVGRRDRPGSATMSPWQNACGSRARAGRDSPA